MLSQFIRPMYWSILKSKKVCVTFNLTSPPRECRSVAYYLNDPISPVNFITFGMPQNDHIKRFLQYFETRNVWFDFL